ncbi:unnamed protein product [Bursaphelenchus okinawaensis]|uniref:Uncharacterized protein n=1 Tax=Bursaphelenchus okinawaensis TaxID=465554 RepID=A0A811L8I7_9BILA|nr:unnamed protein product [Bursaphelenchus okinawaensis]CAG9118285.1 unnamed protein product [Bursaphelenchus okinawaensis]
MFEEVPDLLLDWKVISFYQEIANLNISVVLVTLFAFAVLYFIYNNGERRFHLNPNRIVNECRRNYVLITGCDSGFGQKLAITLAERGVNVFAACLTEAGEEQMKRETLEFGGWVHTIRLDITSQESVDKCFKTVSSTLKKQKAKLWSLVNNAGFCAFYGPSDWVTTEEYKTSIDVNLLGTIRMSQKFIPLLKRSRGRLVTMVSISGRIHGFYTAPYVTAKYGLEGFMDSVRLELRPFGVTAHIIEPGAFKTTLLNKNAMLDRVNKTWMKLPKHVQNEYGEEFKENFISQWMSGVDLVANPNLTEVINAYMHAILSTRPKTRYVCGLDARLLFLPLSFLPSAVQDFILAFLPRLQLAPALVPKATTVKETAIEYDDDSEYTITQVKNTVIDENFNEKFLKNGISHENGGLEAY